MTARRSYTQTKAHTVTKDRTAPAFYALLDHLCVIRVSGDDAENFLHGQLTNDLKSLSPGQIQLQGYCSPKGRLLAQMHLTLDNDDILLIAPDAIVEPLLKRLRMFVMRAKVLFEIDQEVAVIGVSDTADYPANAPRPLLTLGDNTAALVLLKQDQLAEAETTLAARYDKGAALDWAASRLLAGEPQIHPDSQDKFVPQMVNLDRLGGISFRKGCYPGQEIIARTRYLGKVKRRMHLFQTAPGLDAAPCTPVYVEDNERAVGELVELLPAGDKTSVASAVIRLEHAGKNLFLGAADGPMMQPIPLPYSLQEEES